MRVWLVTTHIVDHDDDHVIAASLEAAKRLVIEVAQTRSLFWAGDQFPKWVMEFTLLEYISHNLMMESYLSSENYFLIQECNLWE